MFTIIVLADFREDEQSSSKNTLESCE